MESNNLKKYREALDLSLRDLEESTGISNSYLSQLENGKAENPTVQKARRLAFMLKTTVDELFPHGHQTVVALNFTVTEIENGYLVKQKKPIKRVWGFRNDEELISFIGAYLLDLPH